MRFSRRLPVDRPNRLARLLAERPPALDLTVSNPTVAGFRYPSELWAALADPAAATYAPSPRGLPAARAAVAAHVGVPAESIVLTASTSEAYAWLAKLLCDPGDAVLCPEPSYPLFEHLLALEGVRPLPYPLAYDGEWHIDFAALGGDARAIIVVSPGNPHGAYLKRAEWERLGDLGLPVVCDEVFADYPILGARDAMVPAARPDARALTFSLGGLSKSCGLPQVKLGWIAAAGPGADEALARLEHIADTYLSVSAPTMAAAPRLLEIGAAVRDQIRARVRANHDLLAGRVVGTAATLLRAEGGWSAVLRVPGTRSDEELALALLGERGVLVHPGYFFDLRGGTFLVVSLLTPPETFAAGIDAILGA
ncbi:MAG TPA: pyridoxal phosphate-dependent aminotransferase [Haliangiales bacterium]|nr:pyridoxal phosphate-dependent aminotransferase [Haliangiales bacterium]